MRPEEIKTWSFEKLDDWLRHSSNQEGWDVEFKERLPDSRNDIDKDKLRQAFCSFANSQDGIIFFGITDDKLPQGLMPDPQFQTKLSQIVSEKIFPPLQPTKWGLVHTIALPNHKEVCVVRVEESFYTFKPHMNNGKVYKRLNGHKQEISNGEELRRIFLKEEFYPEHKSVLINILQEMVEKCDGSLSYMDVIFFEKFKSYLSRSLTNSPSDIDVKELKDRFSSLELVLIKLRRSCGPTQTEEEFGELNSLKENFRQMISQIHGKIIQIFK
jgi:schlafen family protein